MEVSFGEVVTVIGLFIAAAVADYKAITEELFRKAESKVYTVLGAAFTALFAVYVDRIVIS